MRSVNKTRCPLVSLSPAQRSDHWPVLPSSQVLLRMSHDIHSRWCAIQKSVHFWLMCLRYVRQHDCVGTQATWHLHCGALTNSQTCRRKRHQNHTRRGRTGKQGERAIPSRLTGNRSSPSTNQWSSASGDVTETMVLSSRLALEHQNARRGARDCFESSWHDHGM